jgi:sulfatase maturation enzyme AslB (radical SAM superfamily)
VSNDKICDHIENKSKDGWDALLWTTNNYHHVDTQAQITIHAKSLPYIEEMIEFASNNEIFTGINMIHYDSDGRFDFFPSEFDIRAAGLYIKDNQMFRLEEIAEFIEKNKGCILLQNPEYISQVLMYPRQNWHCKGDPYGGPTVDADGSLRLCGYRKGTRTPMYNVWDLQDSNLHSKWEEAVQKDAEECPGCSWSYPMMYKYHKKDEDFGKIVFARHAGKHIPEHLWSRKEKYET